MIWLSLVNLLLAVLSWKWANEAFQNGNTGAGWFNVFASALNAAAFASVIL
jgi:hypothetical protein